MASSTVSPLCLFGTLDLEVHVSYKALEMHVSHHDPVFDHPANGSLKRNRHENNYNSDTSDGYPWKLAASQPDTTLTYDYGRSFGYEVFLQKIAVDEHEDLFRDRSEDDDFNLPSFNSLQGSGVGCSGSRRGSDISIPLSTLTMEINDHIMDGYKILEAPLLMNPDKIREDPQYLYESFKLKKDSDDNHDHRIKDKNHDIDNTKDKNNNNDDDIYKNNETDGELTTGNNGNDTENDKYEFEKNYSSDSDTDSDDYESELSYFTVSPISVVPIVSRTVQVLVVDDSLVQRKISRVLLSGKVKERKFLFYLLIFL